MKSILLLAATSLLFLIPQSAFACSCAFTTPATAYNDVAAVFIGKMISGTETNLIDTGDGREISLDSGDVTFEVSKVYKGSIGKSVTISVASHKGSSCGTYGLVRSVEYVVWAYSRDKGSGKLYTGVCTRTRPVAGDNEDIEFLRALPPKGSGGNIKGRIWLDTKVTNGGAAKPMPNIPVTIQAILSGRIFKVVTNAEGEFELNKVAAGTYKVTPTIPENYFVEEISEKVEVDDLGTASTGFEFYHDTRVNGRLIDKYGNVYDHGFFQLEGTNKRVYGHSTGEKGFFTVDGIPPGTYLLYIDIKNDDYKKNRKYYYPGTFEIANARMITIGLGQKINVSDFSLPSEFRVRTISGKISMPDGKPASGVFIYLACQMRSEKNSFFVDASLPTVESDKDGNFEIQGFAGTDYSLRASSVHPMYADQENELDSPPRQIVLTSNVKGIQLILSEKHHSPTPCP